METIAFRMLLDPGKRDEYERRHREIWPELVSALHEAGVSNYRIFLDESTHALFAILDRRDDHHGRVARVAHHAQMVGLHG